MELKQEQSDIASWLAARTEAFVFVPVGFGKTIITLTAIMEMRDVYGPWRTLVVSTKNIIEHTWGQEISSGGSPSRMRARSVEIQLLSNRFLTFSVLTSKTSFGFLISWTRTPVSFLM